MTEVTKRPYEPASGMGVRQGLIYRYRPIPWLSPPVWVLSYVNWTARRAMIRMTDLTDTFRDRARGNQEYIVCEGKLRYVIVWYVATPRSRTASVAPVYSLSEHKSRAFIEAVREGRFADKFFLPAARDFGIQDSYADLGKIQPIDVEFLTEDAKVGMLSSIVWRAMLVQYGRCLTGR